MERISHVHDSTGNLIFFDQNVLNDKQKFIKLSNEQYAKAAKTISSPAIIIELNDWLIRYYYRAICWDNTVLVGAGFINGLWQVQQYFENPSGSFVLTLLKRNLLESDITLYLQNEIVDNSLDNPST